MMQSLQRAVRVSPQYAAWLLLLFCSVLALILSPSAAFSPSSSRFSFPTRLLRPSPAPSISISSLFVFERMSEDCIAGLVEAQAVASKYQSASVGTDCLLAGCLQHPTPSLRKTLTRYKLTYRNCQQVLKELYKESDQDNNNNNNNNFLSSFQFRKQKEEDRPFSTAAKQVLQRAGTYVAVTNSNNNKNNKNKDTTSTTTIETHHVFLSLLEYTPTKDIDDDEDDTTAPTTTRNNPESDAWAVLQRMQGWKEGRNNDHDNNEFASAREISLALVEQIQANPQSDKRELVTGGGSSSSSTTSTPTLAECGVDLTEQARDGLLDPVYGREMEIRACLRTLLRRRKNNVCLIGDPGVGKTAIAEGVAQLLVDEDTSKCPSKLQGYRLISLELSQLVSGTKYRGEFEERLQAILKELEDPKAPPTILFIDEIHNLVGAGAAEGGIDMANILKPYLARGQLQLIGATTIAEYRKYIEKDAALERRLQPVMVKETNVEQTISILEAVQSNYAKHHDVKYTPAALHAAAVLSERYITDRFLPDKALDLLDEAGAIAQLENDGVETPVVTEHVIAELISEMSGIPVGKLESSEMDRLRSLDDQLENRVKGQPKACSAVGRAIRRARSGLRDPKRPVASFLFCGPTGTGKTELCKTLAETYYGSEKDMIRIDMSEYMDKHTVSRLTGPPPGYIGYEEGGQLTEAVRRAPHSVVLLDEIEKAHEDVLNILLQIMEDGILTDGKGRTVNFKNAIIVMTSNVGSRRILDVTKQSSTSTHAVHKSPETPVPAPAAPKATPKNNKDPVSAEEALKKLQANPKATSLLLEAASDPDIMGAIRTAMNGSPADLLEASRGNPTVAAFLQRLWHVMEDTTTDSDDSSFAANTPVASTIPPEERSGLQSIRASILASGVLLPSDDSNNPGHQGHQQSIENTLYPQLLQVVKEELESQMKPELLNRIDEIIVFSPLSHTDLQAIARLIIARTLSRALSEQELQLEIGPQLLQQIVLEGSAKADQFGARPMRRAVQRYVEDGLSDAILQGFLIPKDTATLELGNSKNQVQVHRQRDAATLAVAIEDASGIDSGSIAPATIVNGESGESSTTGQQQQPQSMTSTV